MNDPEGLAQRLAETEQRLKELDYVLSTTNARLQAVESSVVFRIARRVGRPLLDASARVRHWLGSLPFSGRRRDSAYAAWSQRCVASPLPALQSSPSFSLLLDASAAAPPSLVETIASLQAQTYTCWDLSVCVDAAAAPAADAWLGGAILADSRIRRFAGDGRIGALNQAANACRGDYVVLLPPNTRLVADALHRFAAAHPADLIYADEDRVDDAGRPVSPLFKPDWSPDLLLSCMYFGSILAISREAWAQAGGLRPEHKDVETYDLALRLTDSPRVVRHVPEILLHARVPDPEAAPVAASAAVEDALRRRASSAELERGGGPSGYHVRWLPAGAPLASIVVCSRSPRLLDRCLTSLSERSAYPHRELVVVQHLGADDSALERVIQRHGARRVPYDGPFHFSRMNNLAARAAAGEVLVFLNDDTEPLSDSWLDRLVGHALRADVGIVGARLLYPSGTVQHAGVAVGIGDGCGHIGRGSLSAPFWPWIAFSRDVAAVTGACMAIRASIFRELEGFDELFPSNYNDTDLCLRVRQVGYRVVYDPAIVLRHDEAQSRQTTVTLEERRLWYRRWSAVIDAGDPFYTPHLTHQREDLSLGD